MTLCVIRRLLRTEIQLHIQLNCNNKLYIALFQRHTLLASTPQYVALPMRCTILGYSTCYFGIKKVDLIWGFRENIEEVYAAQTGVLKFDTMGVIGPIPQNRNQNIQNRVIK